MPLKISRFCTKRKCVMYMQLFSEHPFKAPDDAMFLSLSHPHPILAHRCDLKRTQIPCDHPLHSRMPYLKPWNSIRQMRVDPGVLCPVESQYQPWASSDGPRDVLMSLLGKTEWKLVLSSSWILIGGTAVLPARRDGSQWLRCFNL